MSKEKRRVPKLRFPGFTEDWEQCKLGDIATLSKGNGYSKSDLSASGNPIILYGRLYTNYETTIRNVDTFVKLKDKSVISQGGEVIVPASGETAEDISRASVVKNQGVIIGGDLNVIKVNILLDPTFLALTISNGEQQKELSKRAQGKSVVHLHNSDLQEVNLIFPLLNEQRKISTLFEKMDNIITLHQRKLNNLKLKKKALLQKLFPKNGERYPELRFPGFTDAWEQRKLSEVVAINPKTELPDEFKYVDLESVVGTNLLGFQVIKKENAPSRAQRLASYGDVFYQTVRPYQRNNYLFENVDKDMVFSTGYAQLRSRLDSYFLLTLVQNDNFVKVVLDNCTGTSYPAINGSELGKITVQIPPNEVEANQIGKIFRRIDKSITLHQRKLDHLQLQKKALLQQMFV